jgi:hypothetical protein
LARIGGNSVDDAYSIQQTSDGGYIIAGGTYSFGAGGSDAFIVKLDSLGNVTWAKTIGGAYNDVAYSIQQTSDGGYIIAGGTYSFGAGGSDAFIVKLDSLGNVTWAKTIGGADDDWPYSIQQTSDGGYIIAGKTYSFGAGGSDAFIVKLDSLGNVTWAKTIGGAYFDVAYSIQQTSDGGYIITGYMDGAFIVKLNSSGNVTWAKTIGEVYFYSPFAYSIQQTSDGGYIMVVGRYIVKLDFSGNLSWAKEILYLFDYAYSIQQTSDGGYIIAAGKTDSFDAGGSNDVFIVKLNSSGNVTWAKTIGGVYFYIWPYSIQQTSDGGYIIAGYTSAEGDAFVIKLDSSGNIPGCSYISSVSPTVLSQSPTVSSSSPTVSSVSINSVSQSPTVNSISITPSFQCSP